MTRVTARPVSLGRREIGAAGRPGHNRDRVGRATSAHPSPASAILTDPQAPRLSWSPVRADEIEHLRELTERARIAFEVARDAFLQLETVHEKGRVGTVEKATFLAKVALFREAAHAVHEAVVRRRERPTVRAVTAAGTEIHRTTISS